MKRVKKTQKNTRCKYRSETEVITRRRALALARLKKQININFVVLMTKFSFLELVGRK